MGVYERLCNTNHECKSMDNGLRRCILMGHLSTNLVLTSVFLSEVCARITPKVLVLILSSSGYRSQWRVTAGIQTRSFHSFAPMYDSKRAKQNDTEVSVYEVVEVKTAICWIETSAMLGMRMSVTSSTNDHFLPPLPYSFLVQGIQSMNIWMSTRLISDVNSVCVRHMSIH